VNCALLDVGSSVITASHIKSNVTTASPDNLLNVTPVEVTFSLVIIIDGVDDVLFPVLDDLPHGATDHVPRWDRCYGQSFAFALQVNGLRKITRYN